MAQSPDPHQRQLDNLRRYRNRREADLSLGFLQKQFRRDVERPFKQLGELAELWARLVPADLQTHARLESFRRGILRVTVDSSAHLYQLDRLLRSGIQRELVAAQKGHKLHRVQLQLGVIERDRRRPT